MKKSILLFPVFGAVLFSACKKEKNSDVSTPTLSLMNDSMTYDSFFVRQDEILGIAAKYNEKTFFKGIVEDVIVKLTYDLFLSMVYDIHN